MASADTQTPAAVVSGANRGLGLELCRQLLQRGWPVVALCRRTSPELEGLAQGRDGTGAASALPATAASRSSHSSPLPGSSRLTVVQGIDVAEDSCRDVLRQALSGVPVGLLILNAGTLSVDSVAELDPAVVRQQFEVNTLGPLRVVHALLPNLVAARPEGSGGSGSRGAEAHTSSRGGGGAAEAAGSGGSGPEATAAGSGSGGGGADAAGGSGGGTPAVPAVVPARVAFITSKMGSIALTREGGKNGSAGYRLSKAAANMVAQLIAVELAPRGVPVVAIHPGAVATDMYAQYWEAVAARGAAGAAGMAPSAHGPVSVEAAAAGVLARLDELALGSTGRFVQAANGEELPW